MAWVLLGLFMIVLWVGTMILMDPKGTRVERGVGVTSFLAFTLFALVSRLENVSYDSLSSAFAFWVLTALGCWGVIVPRWYRRWWASWPDHKPERAPDD